MPNWRSIVERKNAETYRLPAGWDSRETVAEQLDCSPERVATILRPAIKSGSVEKKTFPVWDKNSKRIVQTVAYREAIKKPAPKTGAKASPSS